jgi:hypothetical protein
MAKVIRAGWPDQQVSIRPGELVPAKDFAAMVAPDRSVKLARLTPQGTQEIGEQDYIQADDRVVVTPHFRVG